MRAHRMTRLAKRLRYGRGEPNPSRTAPNQDKEGFDMIGDVKGRCPQLNQFGANIKRAKNTSQHRVIK